MRLLAALLVAVGLMAAPRSAFAARGDDAATRVVTQVLIEEYAQGNFATARKKLQSALDKCGRRSTACSPPVKAQLHIAMGMIQSQLGQEAESKATFVTALKLDKSALLPPTTTPAIRNSWKEALVAVGREDAAAEPDAAAAAAATTSATVGASSESTEKKPPSETPTDSAAAAEEASAAAGKPVAGWRKPEAYTAAMAGLAAGSKGNYDECISKDKESVEAEDRPRTRIHLASCESKSGKLIDALRDASKALEMGIKAKDAAVMKVARTMIQELVAKIPHVTFVPPTNAEDLTVTFDERAVPNESLTKKFSIDPGKHVVHAEGTVGGIPMAFDHEFEVKPSELLTVNIQLQTAPSQYLTPGQLRCMLGAKTQEEVNKCLPQGEKNLVSRVSMEVGGYSDTTATNVISPRIVASVVSPTAGWNVGANYLLDVYTAASPDIVSYGSPRYSEFRNAIGASAGYKPGLYGVTVRGNWSREPDYQSASGGVTLTGDFRDKLITPLVSYTFQQDTIGYKSTPWENFSRGLTVHSVDAGVTFVLSPTVVLITNLSMSFERGDQSKPYRLMPFFSPDIAPRVPVGASIDLVNANRESVRANEQLPTARDRYAIAARLAKRFSSSTLRIEERLYYDTWKQISSSTDARWLFDLSKRLRVWPHARFNFQTATNFYRRAYTATETNGSWSLPLYRTGDRELSPMFTATAGGGIRLALSPHEAKTQFAVTVQADAMYSRFLDSLFVTQRLAAYGAFAIEAEFE